MGTSSTWRSTRISHSRFGMKEAPEACIHSTSHEQEADINEDPNRALVGFGGFWRALAGFGGLRRALAGFIRFYPVLSGFIRFYPVLSGFIRFYRVLSGFMLRFFVCEFHTTGGWGGRV